MKNLCFKLLLFLLFLFNYNVSKACYSSLCAGGINGGVFTHATSGGTALNYSDNANASVIENSVMNYYVTGDCVPGGSVDFYVSEGTKLGVYYDNPLQAHGLSVMPSMVNDGITVSAITTSPVCSGSTISVPVITVGSFNSNNNFNVQLSNSSGSFTSPTQIGSVASITGGVISAVLPANEYGSGYKIRVVSTSPAFTSNEIALSINSNPTPATISVSPAGDICAGSVFASNIIYGAGSTIQSVTYPPNTSYLFGTGGTGWSVRTATMGNQSGDVVVVIKNLAGCTASSTKHVSVIPMPSNAITTGSISSNICSGETIFVPYTVNGCAYMSANTFTAQLSDASGSFASPTNIGSVTSTISGQISAVIPTSASGTNYRIRVMSSTSIIGTDNGSNINIVSNCGGLTFDGIDDRAIVPYNSAYNIGSNDFTIEAWIKPTSALRPILSNRTASITNTFMFMLYGANKLLIQINGNDFLSNTFNSIVDGNCHHVAVVRDSSAATFYLDGSSVGTVIIGNGGTTVTNNLMIGYDIKDNYSFNGNINEVRFWNTARTSTEISSNRSSVLPSGTANLIGYWRFREPIGETILDQSAIGNNGYLGNSSSTADANNPIRSSAACFSGDRIASDYYETEVFVDNNAVALDAVFYPNPFQNETNIIVRGDGNNKSQIEIFNMKGSSEGKFEVENNILFAIGKELEEGVYIVQIVSEDKRIIKKIVKLD